MGKHKRKPVQAPPNYGAIIDAVRLRDRQHFEAHPEQRYYVRDYVPGELWPDSVPQGSLIEVQYIAEGVRIRRPFIAVDIPTP